MFLCGLKHTRLLVRHGHLHNVYNLTSYSYNLCTCTCSSKGTRPSYIMEPVCGVFVVYLVFTIHVHLNIALYQLIKGTCMTVLLPA